jgi:hypothetical protein
LILEPEEEELAWLAEGMQQALLFHTDGSSVFYGVPAGSVRIEREGRTATLVVRQGEIQRVELLD